MTKEELWKLRQEIVLDSLYARDYRNDMGFTPGSVRNFFDGYSDYLSDKAEENGTAADNAIDDYDSADSLWDYFNTYEDDPFARDGSDSSGTGVGHASDREHAMSGFGESKGDNAVSYWRKAMALNDIIGHMDDEDAYGNWIYVWPDGETAEQAKQDFGTEKDYRELEDFFIKVYKAYHDDGGLYAPSKEVADAAHGWDAKLGLKPIKVIKEIGGIGESDESRKDMDRISRKHDMREGIGNKDDFIVSIAGRDGNGGGEELANGLSREDADAFFDRALKELNASGHTAGENGDVYMDDIHEDGPFCLIIERETRDSKGILADVPTAVVRKAPIGESKTKTGSCGKPMKESDDYGVLAQKYWEHEVEYQMDYLSDYGEDKMKDAIGKLSPDDRQKIIASEASGILENDALWDYVNNEVMDSDLETLILDGKNESLKTGKKAKVDNIPPRMALEKIVHEHCVSESDDDDRELEHLYDIVRGALKESLKTKHAVPGLHESGDVTASDAPKCPCEVITALIDDEKEAVDGYDRASMDINGIKDGNSAASLALFAKIKQEELEHIKELQGLLDAAKAVNGKADDVQDAAEAASDDRKIADAFGDEPVFDDGNDANQLKPVMPAADADITVDADAEKDESRKTASRGTAMTESLKGEDAKHTARVMLRDSRKPINESLTITKTMSLEEFQPWSGAVDTMNKIIDAGKLDDLDFLLEDQYPEGIDETALNDLLWFESDWVLDQLGLKDDDVEPDDDEPEEETEPEDGVAKDDTEAEDYSDVCRNAGK